MVFRVVGVRFKRAYKIYYFDLGDLDLKVGDKVIVETARGIECGYVVHGITEKKEEDLVMPLKKVLRKVNAEDEEKLKDNEKHLKYAYNIALKKIAKHGLPMKLIDVENTLDGSKIIFYFTADGRIDFRELVRDLAAVFKTRIELRQIGVRDEAKMVGGIGCCGRELCCASWLTDFIPVSIRMAKEQNLSLNPTKISGACGRLMCCLNYENEIYEDAKKQFPEIGTRVESLNGKGQVIDFNIFKNTVTVELDDTKSTIEVPLKEIKILEESAPQTRDEEVL
ncbi:stage 0 sporulation family protein [Peptococcaceae bacterium]|nr:stage 0 sporulation family protein [Peptococcaceae bacterium]MCL0106522.1 stage 0 sporulation family protein [Peptococcaceae bacterium]